MNEMNERNEMIREARNTYEWSANRLLTKADGRVVADVAHTKGGVWVAADNSGKRAAKIGEYESEQAAHHAVELRFGLVNG